MSAHESSYACIHHLFEKYAEEQPEATAVVFENASLTYEELNTRANQVAHYLQAQGVRAETFVGIYMERSLDMIIALMAIYKSNGAYVPLDPAYPEERLQFMIEDSGVNIVLTQAHLVDTLPSKADIDTVAVDTHLFDAYPTDNPTGGQANQLAYMIYTSGSTGKPKGVLIEHRSVVSYITAAIQRFGTRATDHCLLFSTINFDSSVEEYLTPLCSGATLYIRTDEMVSSISTFISYLETWRITTMSLPTAFWHELVNEMESLPDHLRYVVIGGEKAHATRLARWQSLTDTDVWNTYGPTEATVVVTMAEVSDADTAKEVPLGTPMRDVSMYILDSELKQVPDGKKGELYFGGNQLARGYHNRPDLTAERFIQHPTLGERLYKSGDLARIREDGELEFLGRSDDQVKIRGFRVELGSIESKLQHMTSGAVVLAKYDDAGDLRLVAYVVSNESVESIHAYLKEQLPAYMVPSAYVMLDELPIAAGGKVDKKALPDPDWSANNLRNEYVAPRNEAEEKLVAIWSDALKIPKIGITDNFFDLGGHSLLAIRIFARIEKEFGYSLPLATLFRSPTIAQLAELLMNDAIVPQDDMHAAIVPIQTTGGQAPFFCIGGGVINLNNVARLLGTEQPFYALQWQGLPDNLLMRSDLPEIASEFVRAVKTVQPTGPYYLGGSFTAGMIVVEIARQLENNGEKVALLVGFNAVVRNSSASRVNVATTPAKPKRSMGQKIKGILSRSPSDIWENYITNPYFFEQAQLRFYRAAIALHMKINRPLPMWLRTGMAEEELILQVTKTYNPPEKYAGDFDIYLTPREYEKYGRLDKFGWDKWVAGEVRVHEMPGEPCTLMLDPNVEELALDFKDRLENSRIVLNQTDAITIP